MLLFQNSLNAAAWVFAIADVAWNEVQTRVGKFLASAFANVHARCETVGLKVGFDAFLNKIGELNQVFLFFKRQFKIIGNMALGNNQRMTFGDGITVQHRITQRGLCQQM